MAISKQQLEDQIKAALKEVKDARPGVDSAVALIDSLQEQVLDLINNADDLDEAAASVEILMNEYRSQKKALSDAIVAPTPVPPGPGGS